MKKIARLFFSSRTTIVLLFLFIIAMGSATFIEDRYDTVTARIFVYDAKWFEVLLLLLAANFIGMIKRYKLLSRKKWAGLTFHLAFVIMILGAALTRYVGFEGTMHIREGESSNFMFSSDPYLKVQFIEGNDTSFYEGKRYFSPYWSSRMKIEFESQDEHPVVLSFNKYIPNAEETIVENVVTDDGDQGKPLLYLNVDYKGRTQVLEVPGSIGYTSFSELDLEGLKIRITYGEKPLQLPFALHLDDFVLDRYAGSMSPSSYSSMITLIDEKAGVREPHLIFMNNVLDYRGYRFFQSSYDEDEKGTVLSVNNDRLGTWVSYLGYFLLGLGFVLTLLNRNSHFRSLGSQIHSIRELRKSGPAFVLLLIGLNLSAKAQGEQVQLPIAAEHADRFGELIVQTYTGRFEPVHTLAIDVMHKVSRKDKFEMPGKGTLTDMQVFLDIIMDGPYWQDQKIIYVGNKSIRDELGIQSKYAALTDFFDQQMRYRLAGKAEKAFRKRKSELTPFEKEIIRLDERVNILISLFNASILRIYPLEGSQTHHWISPVDSLAFMPLKGEVALLGKMIGVRQVTYNSLTGQYFMRLMEAKTSGDYSGAEQILSIIESQQRQLTPPELLPSKRKIKLETFYNNANIFIMLKWVYALLSVALLILAFLQNLKSKKHRVLDWSLRILIMILAMTFSYQSFGMGLRWYLSGHAPWSNGYEALLLVSWGSLLAGFSFMRYSKITLAATVMLAFSLLMTASHSSYDPQLTNLQPVLKSYWLIIHVAAITVSYGFLGLGFILGLINLSMSLFRNRRNQYRLDLISEELTLINEMTLTIGLVLASLGTFLGGVWANESWGRYWGWDAKETWALIIVMAYALILHLRLVPKWNGRFLFNTASVLGFGSVIMTFVGVNYYFSKGMHSYASGSTPVFPVWAWVMILSILVLALASGIKEKRDKILATKRNKNQSLG